MNSRAYPRFAVLLAVTTGLPATPIAASSQTRPSATDGMRSAEAALMRHDFDAVEAGYRQTLATDTSSARQLRATVALARLAWRVRRDSATAQQLLMSASRIDPQAISVPLERAQMLIAFGELTAARQAADSALAVASTPMDRARAAAVLAVVLIEPVLARTDSIPKALALTDADREALRELTRALIDLVRDQPGVLEPARLLVTLGALTADGPAILEGWRSCYLIGALDDGGLLAQPGRLLATLLPGWNDETATLTDRIAVVHALADSRFFDAAAVLGLQRGRDGTIPARIDRRAAEIVAYSRFRRRMTTLVDEVYRRIAVGDSGTVDEIQDGMLQAAETLWLTLQWSGAPTPLTWDNLPAVLRAKFGAEFSLGLTSGYPSLHMGHAVVDEIRTVHQNGRYAEVRFVSLDAMTSNGFQTWAWDGRASTGGWGTATQIIQVRPAYVGEPLSAWRAVTDTALRTRTARRIAADSSADIARAHTDSVAFFSSIPARLLRDARDQMMDSLRASGLSGTELETAFKRTYADALRESSIFAHEGRHAIDQKHEPDLSSEELEFRAKISQVVFASHPRLAAVSGIFQENIGDGTPHGLANERIMRGLMNWMRVHAAEVDTLNPSDPLLPQVPLLTDVQLRAAFASMDPDNRM